MTEIKKIKGEENYFAGNDGCIYKKVGHETKRGWCEFVTTNNKHNSVHRAIAEAFVPNPENKNEVHHINGIRNDNRPENLEWINRTEHMKKHIDYMGMTPVKNYTNCELWYKNEKIKDCISILDGAREAHKRYGSSVSSLYKYKKVGDVEIKIKCND